LRKKGKGEKKEEKEPITRTDSKMHPRRAPSTRTFNQIQSTSEIFKLFKLENDEVVEQVFECNFKNCSGNNQA